MSRWKGVCAYDGTGFEGWQSQPSKNAVQDAIEARLEAVLKKAVRIHASGRTDSGVHARGQVFHFDADWNHGAAKLAAALRSRLPRSIQIVSLNTAKADFHARFSATSKVYAYHIVTGDADPFQRPYCWVVPRRLDLASMREAARLLAGTHDFKAFSAENGADPDNAGGTVRNLMRLEVACRGRRLRIVAEADGFLYKMVRRLVGALVAVGEGRLSKVQVASLLARPERSALVETAPPQGLFLEKVRYRARPNSVASAGR